MDEHSKKFLHLRRDFLTCLYPAQIGFRKFREQDWDWIELRPSSFEASSLGNDFFWTLKTDNDEYIIFKYHFQSCHRSRIIIQRAIQSQETIKAAVKTHNDVKFLFFTQGMERFFCVR